MTRRTHVLEILNVLICVVDVFYKSVYRCLIIDSEDTHKPANHTARQAVERNICVWECESVWVCVQWDREGRLQIMDSLYSLYICI